MLRPGRGVPHRPSATTRTTTDTIYGAAKVFNEGLLRSFHDMYGLDYVALRYFNVYGPRMDIHGVYTEVLIRWMERIAAGQPPLILGDGTQTMDFVYVDDIARANVLAAEADVTDEVFNVATGDRDEPRRAGPDPAARSWTRTSQPEFGPERSVNNVSRRLADTRRRPLGFTPRSTRRGPAPPRRLVAAERPPATSRRA